MSGGGASPERRHLWLLRHGKAASDAPWGGGDAERPLAARGRRDATALGTALGRREGPFGTEGLRPPVAVLCSTAVRTRQTADLVIEASGLELPLEPVRSLYDADVDTVLDVVREIDGAVTSVLVVGHNPSMYRLAYELLDDGDGGERSRDALADHRFPTCALAALVLPVADWREVSPGTAELGGLFTPPY
jgi:phosphohistidine phosphatase